MRALSIGLLVCACGDNAARPNDAGPDVSGDASVDALSPDAPQLIGYSIGGTALGVRATVVLTLTTGSDTRHAVVNADGAFQFPGVVPPGSSYAVTTSSTACDVSGGSGADVAADVTTVQVFCNGVVELASVAFASGMPAVAFTSVLTPAFDPGATTYSGTRPFFMDDTDVISVTPVAAYPTLSSITVYTDPTTSGQASPSHVLGASVPVRLQHSAALDRTYQFTLLPAKPVETAFIKTSAPAAFDYAGTVALSGNVLVVGARNRGGTGAAFVLRRSATGWTEEKVIQPTADAGARAGSAVAIDGEVLVVGAPVDAADNSGRAYVYRYNATSQAWALDGGGVLSATIPAANAACGYAVAVSGARIVIGCPGEKGAGNAENVGAVYMFRYDTASSSWLADGTFKGANAYDALGSAVALSDVTAVVGAPFEDDGATNNAGGVHVLVRGASSWSQQGTTLRGDLVANANFGSAVAISGDYAVVGAPAAAGGSAYVFHRVSNAWSLDGPKLAAALVVPELPRFGSAVAIDGTHVVIGAPQQDLGVGDAGVVHAYRRDATGWTISHAIGASNPSPSRFGASVAIDGEWFAAGAPDESSVAGSSGAVYVFR